jgi:hypothetical protein
MSTKKNFGSNYNSYNANSYANSYNNIPNNNYNTIRSNIKNKTLKNHIINELNAAAAEYELPQELMQTKTNYTINELKKIFENENLELSVEEGNKVLSRYIAISQIDASQLDKIEGLEISTYNEKVSNGPQYSANNIRKIFKIENRSRGNNTRLTLRTGTGIGDRPVLNMPLYEGISVYGGAYKGAYLENGTVTAEQYTTYIFDLYDTVKIEFIKQTPIQENSKDFEEQNKKFLIALLNEVFKVNNSNYNSIKRIIKNSIDFFDNNLPNSFSRINYLNIGKNDFCSEFVKSIYINGSYNDINNCYYGNKDLQHITELKGPNNFNNLYGMQKLIPLEDVKKIKEEYLLENVDEEKLQKIKRYEKKFRYMVIMNYLRLRYNIKHYVNINIENKKEKEMWTKYLLGTQKPPSGNLEFQPECKYYHFEVKDMCSFSIREAIYQLFIFMPLIEKNEKIIFHCAAGFGRTGITLLLLTLCNTLVSHIKEYITAKFTSNPDNVFSAKTKIENFIGTFLGQGWNLNNLKTLFGSIYSGKPLNEIFENKNRTVSPEFLNILRAHRINAIIIAILYYISAMGYYRECEPWISNIDIQLIYYSEINIDNSEKKKQMNMKFNLESIQANISKISLPHVLNLIFYLTPTIMAPLKKSKYKTIYNGSNLPAYDKYHEIGPDIVVTPITHTASNA